MTLSVYSVRRPQNAFTEGGSPRNINLRTAPETKPRSPAGPRRPSASHMRSHT